MMASVQENIHVHENGIWKGPKLILPENYYQCGELLLEKLKQSPDFVGQIDGSTGEKETFYSMADKSVRCAIWLRKQGIKPGEVIGYCSKNKLESFVPLYASLYIGSIFNPWWDSCLKKELVEYFTELTEPKVLFVDRESATLILESIPGIINKLRIVIFGKMDGFESLSEILKEQTSEEVKNFECTKVESADEPAVILYTSGTTGRPKAALHTYGSFRRIIGFFPDDEKVKIGIWFSTFCWLSGTLNTLRTVFIKYTAIINNCSNEKEYCRLIQLYKVTWITMGTRVVNRLYKTKEISNYDLSSIARASFFGSVMKKEVEEFLRDLFPTATLISLYGCTEYAPVSLGIMTTKKPTTVGRVTQDTQLKIIDPETNQILKTNQEGELCYKGSMMMSGYWKNPDATFEVIDSEGWYHSGDLGYCDEDGYIFIIGRLKELIKYRLHRVPPAAIERVILNHPAVAEVAVVAKPHPEDIEQPIAFITKCLDAQVTEQEIIDLVNNEMHNSMRLRGGVKFLEEMPYTASGKIAKKELRAIAEALSQVDTAV